jgi:hypothetical protein
VIAGNATLDHPDPRGTAIITTIRDAYRGVLMVCGGCDYRKALACLDANQADLIAFGRAFLPSSDLQERFRQNAPLNQPDEATVCGGGAQGYIDYRTLRSQPIELTAHAASGTPEHESRSSPSGSLSPTLSRRRERGITVSLGDAFTVTTA